MEETGGSPRPASLSAYRIVQLLPADGWREILWNSDQGGVRVFTRPVLAWALVEDERGTRHVDCVRGEDFLVGSGARDEVRGVDSYFESAWTMTGASLGFVPAGEEVPIDYHSIAQMHADKEDPDGSLRERMRTPKRSRVVDIKLEYAKKLVAEGLDPDEVGRELGMPKALVRLMRG